MLKKYLFFIVFTILALVCAVFSGCALSPEDVKLKTADQCKAYVEENYCPCELVSEEKTDSDKTITYTFKDTELGFTFTVISGVTSEGMDGAAFYYTSSLKCDYDEVYDNWLMDSTAAITDELCSRYGMTFTWNEHYYHDIGLVTFEEEDLSKAEKALTELGTALAGADVRERLKFKEISCVGGTADVGTFYFENMYFMPVGSEFIAEMKSALEGYTGLEDMEYHSAHSAAFENVYGASSADIPDVPDKPFRVLIFRCMGEEWQITDLRTASGKYYYYRCDAAYYGTESYQ